MTFFDFELSAATTRRASDTVYMEKIPGQLKVLKGLVSKFPRFQIIKQSNTHPHTYWDTNARGAYTLDIPKTHQVHPGPVTSK